MTSVTNHPSPPPLVDPADTLEQDELARYSRHILLPEIGMLGQRRLKNARVLVIGAGGLGSPVLLYLAAAGVGTLGIIDDDHVESSNLQRQIVHGSADVERRKVASAGDAIVALNPLVHVEAHPQRLTPDNAAQLFEQYDLVVDGADNFATRYLVSDAAELTGKPHVWGSILRFAAQVSVFWAAHGPTYRDVYPDVPPADAAPTCSEVGVLGALCGVAGSMMAAEAIKLITGTGRTLLGRLSIFDLADSTWRELHTRVDGARSPIQALYPSPGLGVAGECAPERHDSITVAQLEELLRARSTGGEDFELVDVREADESAIARIPHSLSVPLSGLRETGTLPGIPPDRRLVIYCKAGPRARAAATILRRDGYADIRVLDGGMDGWLVASGSRGGVCL